MSWLDHGYTQVPERIYADEPHRIAEESSPIGSKKKNHKSRIEDGKHGGQRARDLVPHGPLTTTRLRRSSFIFLIPLFILLAFATAWLHLRAARRVFYIACFRRELHGARRQWWRWLIVAPLSRDNEISVYATRSPAGATLSFSLSQDHSTFPALVLPLDRRAAPRRFASIEK